MQVNRGLIFIVPVTGIALPLCTFTPSIEAVSEMSMGIN